MNNFERVAIFTMIEGIESQLRGLKTLLATNSNQEASKSYKVEQHDPFAPQHMSEQDELALAKKLNDEREAQVKSMAEQGQTVLQGIWHAASELEEKPN